MSVGVPGASGMIFRYTGESTHAANDMDERHIRNRCAHQCIDPLFLPIIELARAGMAACCGACLRELRLLGSIARGDARAGHADLDMIALLDGAPTAGESDCVAALAASLGAGTHVVTRLDLEAVDANALTPFRRFVLSSDFLCIYGADTLTLRQQSMERFALAKLVTPDPETMLPDYLEWVGELAGADATDRRLASRTIGKDLLKVLRGVLLLRGAEYEVAIPCIAAQVPHVVLEAADIAERLFALYTDPITDLDAIRQAVTDTSALLKGCPEFASLCRVDDAALASPGGSAPSWIGSQRSMQDSAN
ncbi:MAG: hypothetical protein KC432_01570 [Thermomicrobiales bacterium]|nr:hypothetical protein [Thermomicrobiales bacterium]